MTKPTCIETGKSSAKSGGKNRSACFFENPGLPAHQLECFQLKFRLLPSFRESPTGQFRKNIFVSWEK